MSYAEADMGLPSGMTIGDHFLIRRKLGGGGMGEVYLAENLNVPDKKYAIKVLRQEFSGNAGFVEMLRDEAMKQSRLEHDNVGGMYDFFAWQGSYCLVQNFVDGKTLQDLLAEHPNGLLLAQALPMMMGILAGLDYAHAMGILHCDIKASNVIVAPDGRPRVIDFGIAQSIGPVAHTSRAIGAYTAEYVSPEQVLSPHAIDHRADVFSAGVLFFEMLAGRLPFDLHPEQIGAALPQLHQDAPDVRSIRPDVPEWIARVVATALQRDPAARFQGCADFRQAIADYLRHVERSRMLRKLVPTLVVVAAIVGGGLYMWSERVKQEQRLAQLRNQEIAAANEARARETAQEAMVNGATSFNLLCREWIDYQLKRKGLDKARDGNFTELIPKFEDKLADMQVNIARHATSYVDSLRQLQATRADIADAVLANPPGGGMSKGDATARRGTRSTSAGMIEGDLTALRTNAAPPTKEALMKRCPAPISAP